MKKMIVRLIFLMIPFVLSTSCTYKTYHPSKSDREWASDHKICEKWVRESIRDEPDTYDNFDEMKLIKECMRKKGWRWERSGLFGPDREESK